MATLIPGFGQLIDKVQAPLTRLFDVRDGEVRMNERVSFPARPMVGVVGVATDGDTLSNGLAGLHGGNSEVSVLGIQNLVTGGDVIVAIDGTPVRRADDVVRVVSSSLKPNDVAVFTIVRDGHEKKVAVTLGERQLPTG